MTMCRSLTKEEMAEHLLSKLPDFYECEECCEMFTQIEMEFADERSQICTYCMEGG